MSLSAGVGRGLILASMYVPLGLLMLPTAEAAIVNPDAAQAILDNAVEYRCGFDASFDEGALISGGCPMPADYWVPYYVVELVPGSFESVFLPDAGVVLNEALGSIQQTVMETLLNGINAGNEGQRVTFSKRAGGSFGNVHYYETHVYRLDFDPLEAFKKALAAKLKGESFSLGSNLLKPAFCYASEIDPFRWRFGVPGRGDDPDPASRYRFWEKTAASGPGFFSWAPLGGIGGWVGNAQSTFAGGTMAVRASSYGARSVTDENQKPSLGCYLEESKEDWCWSGTQYFRCTKTKYRNDFVPLDSLDDVQIQLVYDSNGKSWKSCIPIGWQPQQDPKKKPEETGWTRAEYWTGRIERGAEPGEGGAVFVVYKKTRGCLLDGDLVEDLLTAGVKRAAITALSSGVSALWDIAQVAQAINDLRNSIEDFMKALEEIPKKVEQAKDAMKMILDNIGGGFTALGALLLTGDADVAAGVAQMQMNAAQTGFNMQLEANMQVAEITQRLVSLRIDSVKATGERKRELEEQRKDLERLKTQVEDRAKELVNDLRKQAEQQAKQMAAQGIQLGIGGLFKLLEIPVRVAYSVECAADSAWETYEGVMKLATFEACGVGIGDASRKAGNVIAKMEGFRRDGQRIAKYAKPLFEPACMMLEEDDAVRRIHARVCAPAGGSCLASESFHVKADKFLGYGKYADMACQVIDLVMSPPKEPSGWLIGVMGTVVPNLGDLGGSLNGLEALSNLPDPAPLLSAATRIQSASALTQLERQKAVQDINGLIAGIKGLPANSVKDARRKMQRLAGGEFLKDWAEDVKNDAKAALDSIPKPKFKWSDVKRVASQAGAMARDVKRLTKLATDFDPGDPPKMTEAAIGTITIIAVIPERIDMMATEGKGLARKTSDYATDLGNFVGSTQFGDPFRKLAGRISKLDDDLVAEIETALTPLDGKAIKDLALDFRDLERDAARWVSLGVSEAATLQSFAGQTASILEKASSVRIPTGDLRKALKPVSDKLDQVASFLNELAKPSGPLVQIAGMLKSVGEGFGKMASWADSQRGCKDPQDVNGCVNALFSNPDAKAMNEKGESVLPVGQLIASLGAYAKMQAGGTTTAVWNEASREISEEGKSGSAAIMGRFVRKTVPLRQQEIDDAGGDESAAQDKLEADAKREYENIQKLVKDPTSGGAPTDQEVFAPDSPVKKAFQAAEDGCKEIMRQKGKDPSLCDRKWKKASP